MTDLTLSICIPTYNRAPFLRNLLATFVEQNELRFPFEIVVSDNASTDDTPAIVEEFRGKGLPIRYYRLETNEGYWPNIANIYQMAEGKYAMYLADDDLLVWSNLNAAIDYIESNPDMVVCHAPWLLYDAVTKTDSKPFFQLEKSRQFSRGNFASLFSFITERHIFPEICIYRTDALRAIYLPREFCYWAFSHLAHAIDIGTVGFFDKPFYRSVTRTTIVRDREQEGHKEAMTSWDRYRGGLEYFIYLGATRGKFELTGPKRALLDQSCTQFMLNRMAVALKLWYSRKDYVKAYELFVRLRLNGFHKHPEVERVQKDLPRMAGLQTIARKLNSSPELKYLVLDGSPNPAGFGSMLKQVGLKERFEVIATPADGLAGLASRCAVLIVDEARRAHFLGEGIRAGLVFSEADIIA